MNKLLKTSLLAGTSAFAFVAMSVSPSLAFDRVNWQWDATVTEAITKNVNVNIDLAPTGMVMLEDLQVNIGDVSATSTVSNINNVQPENGGGTVDLGTTDIQFHYGLGGPGEGVVVIEDEFKSPAVLTAEVDEGDQVPNINGTVLATIDLGELEVQPSGSFDALTELPTVVSAATAVANNTSITSDSAVQLHEGQFAFFSEGNAELPSVDGLDGENSNLAAARVLGVLALTGNLQTAEITAVSDVSAILNATVDSSATAVANNMTLAVAPKTDGDSLVIADVVQLAVAQTTATSTVTDINLNRYTNLGVLGSPIVNSVATAVGNNKSISVVAPVVAPVTP
jgi:hypothetical protein